MHFDFAAALVFAAGITGSIWALDAWLFSPRRREHATTQPLPGNGMPATPQPGVKEPAIVEYARSFFPVILVVLVLRSFLVEPFRIPSGSMMPTLLVGDFILVNKFAYGIRLPVVDHKIFSVGEPARGDVVVFRYPVNPDIDYIKRVVGLPGDHIAYADKMLYINGEPIAQTFEKIYQGVGQGLSSSGAELRLEQIDDINHQILVRPDIEGIESEYTVPPGHYFMMGDNRDNSHDSRYWGPVPESNLVGKAFMIWMNWDGSNGGVSGGRIGQHIR